MFQIATLRVSIIPVERIGQIFNILRKHIKLNKEIELEKKQWRE